jgi:folate-binding protein YgfZ
MPTRPDAFRHRLEGLDVTWDNEDPEAEYSVAAEFDDPDRAYWAVRQQGAGLADRSERETLVISGDDTVEWLQGLITGNLLNLIQEGSGLWTPFPNAKGRMVADARILHLPQMLYLDLEPGTIEGGLMAHLRQHIIMEDVTLSDRSEQTARFGLFGPRAAAILEQAGQFKRDPAELDAYQGTWGAIAGKEVILQANPVSGGPGFDLSFDRADSLAIWDAVTEAGGGTLEPLGDETLETLRIEAGIPRFGVETDDSVIPLEANMDELIDFDKGCYVGQEIIARLDTLGTPAKKLRTLIFQGGAAPEPGADIENDDERSVGTVRSAAWSPLLDAPIALGYVKRNSNEPGTVLRVEGREARVERLGYPLEEGEHLKQGA